MKLYWNSFCKGNFWFGIDHKSSMMFKNWIWIRDDAIYFLHWPESVKIFDQIQTYSWNWNNCRPNAIFFLNARKTKYFRIDPTPRMGSFANAPGNCDPSIFWTLSPVFALITPAGPQGFRIGIVLFCPWYPTLWLSPLFNTIQAENGFTGQQRKTWGWAGGIRCWGNSIIERDSFTSS